MTGLLQLLIYGGLITLAVFVLSGIVYLTLTSITRYKNKRFRITLLVSMAATAIGVLPLSRLDTGQILIPLLAIAGAVAGFLLSPDRKFRR